MTAPANRPSAVDARVTASPRRVLLVNRVGYLGGVERILLTLSSGMDEFGWHPILACPDGGALAAAARVQSTDLVACRLDRMRATADPRLLLRYPRLWLQGSRDIEQACRANRIDVIHAHHPVSALYALPAARALRIPLLMHVHETLPAPMLYVAAMRLLRRFPAGFLCVSEAARDLALSLGAPLSRTHVVPNAVDECFLQARSLPPPEAVRRAGPGPHIGSFGVLEPRKAPHVFLQAAAAIAAQFPSARFWIVGPAALEDKQAYADRVRALAATPPLLGRATLAGFQSDVAPWLSAMDLVVQSSVALESFGMAAAEAGALGRPVIATSIGGLPDVVRHEQTGLIIPPNDPVALAQALTRLLLAPALRNMFGRRAATDCRIRFAPALFRQNVASYYDIAVQTL